MIHGAIHPLTPGDPAYAALKVGAVSGVMALKVLLSRRKKQADQEPESVEDPPARQHPVSRSKARSRKRRR